MASHLERRYILAHIMKEREICSNSQCHVPLGGLLGGGRGEGYPAARGGTGTHHPCARGRAMRKLPIFPVTLLPPLVFWMWRGTWSTWRWVAGLEGRGKRPFFLSQVSIPQTKVFVGFVVASGGGVWQTTACIVVYIFLYWWYWVQWFTVFSFYEFCLLVYSGWNRLYFVFLLFVYLFPATNFPAGKDGNNVITGEILAWRSFVALPS